MKSSFLSILLLSGTLASLGAQAHKTLAKTDKDGSSPSGTQGSDLLRFDNGDAFHGRFLGFKQGALRWDRDDLAEPLSLKTTSINQISFNGGHPATPLPHGAYITLENGDEIPGDIVSLDEKNLILDSPVTGQIKIPRALISAIYPNPEGGKLLYTGPYNTDHWFTLVHRETKEEAQKKKVKKASDDPDKKKQDEQAKKTWVHAGAAWYSLQEKPLLLDTKLPDQARINFKIAWRDRLNLAIAFHATMRRPVQEENGNQNRADNEKKPDLVWESATDIPAENGAIPWLTGHNRNNHALTYGACYILTLYSSRPNLYRCSFSPEGKPIVTSIRTNRSQVNLPSSGEADIDLRIDRGNKLIALYINGSYVMQWEDPGKYVATGDYLAFSPLNKSRIRLSDLVISQWNGMTDAARSMQNDKRDILLLNNGTDRFSGTVSDIADKNLTLRNDYGPLKIPLADITEIHLKEDGKEAADPVVDSSDQAVLHYQPHGRLTLTPLKANREELEGRSPLLGELTLDLRPAVLLEFTPGNPALEGWEDEF